MRCVFNSIHTCIDAQVAPRMLRLRSQLLQPENHAASQEQQHSVSPHRRMIPFR